MKFILREYLATLKEDRELDSFCNELLLSMGFVPMTNIQRGRQYGVDIAATGIDEDGIKKVFLLVIKQGNITRQNWNTDKNSVRQSLDEAIDVYLNTHIPEIYKKAPKKIIVCFNGEIDQNVQINWTQFVNGHVREGLEITDWNIHRLLEYSLQYQMPEELIPKDLAFEFRRALAFIDLPDYNLAHIFRFIQLLLPENELDLTEKKVYKKLRLVNLYISIIHSWCKKSSNLKPSYIAIERFVLTTYRWLISNDYFEKEDSYSIFLTILYNWENHNSEYLGNIYKFLHIQDGLSLGIPSHDEYCLITFEQIGILASMGHCRLFDCALTLKHSYENEDLIEYSQAAFSNAETIAKQIEALIDNNPSASNPRYDEHCIEINLALSLFCLIGHNDFAILWLRNIINRVGMNLKIDNFLPLFDSNFEKLLQQKAQDQQSSHFLYFLAEWCIILKQIDHYHILRNLIEKGAPNINLQLWLPDKEVEKFFLTENASLEAGATMTGLKLYENPLTLEMHMAEERFTINHEQEFHCYKNYISFIPVIACRHFRTYPFPNSWRCYLNSNFCFDNKGK